MKEDIAKLEQTLSKIIELKNLGKLDDATELANSTLEKDFSLSKDFLESESTEAFGEYINKSGYTPEHLNLLAQLLFESVYPLTETEETMQVLHKSVLILNILEEQYQQQSVENLHRREIIDKFFSNRQYE